MAYEFESELELEDEFEEELEDESEDELEGEDFLGDILGEGEDFLGDILGEGEDFLGGLLGESEDEFEDEFEAEDEFEGGRSPIRKIYSDAVMEHLGELASEAESEDEAAEHFLPLVGMAASKLLPVVARAVAPMAKRALPKIARVLTKATPKLTRSIATVAKALHRNPRTRHLLKVVPGIARRTVGTIAQRTARGGHITPRLAVHALARQARRVLGSPHHRAKALRRHNHLEHRFHRRGMAHPHLHHGQIRRHGRGLPARGATPGYRPGYRSGYSVPGYSGTRKGGGMSGGGGVTRTASGRVVRRGGAKGGCGCQHCSNCCGCCGRPLR